MTSSIINPSRHGVSPLARWFIPALMFSLLLHGIFYWWANGLAVRRMSPEYYDQIVPRTFRVERVEIDPKSLEPEPAEEKLAALVPVAVSAPEEKISFGELAAPEGSRIAAPKIEVPLPLEKPGPPGGHASATLDARQIAGARSILENDSSLLKDVLADNPATGATAAVENIGPQAGASLAPEGALAGTSQPGYSNLSELLAQTGPLTAETKPILMPTDLLFDYDSAGLREAALESLKQLAVLIERNPHAKFRIEGHTDSFGSEAYNMDLSIRRAEAMRMWLVDAMGVAPERINIRGYGASRLKAPATGTIEEQQINRRVEIVIQTAGSP